MKLHLLLMPIHILQAASSEPILQQQGQEILFSQGVKLHNLLPGLLEN